MDAIGASRPVDDKNTKEKLKAQFLTVLNKKYGITEEDFVSADLSLYPANKARDVGNDELNWFLPQLSFFSKSLLEFSIPYNPGFFVILFFYKDKGFTFVYQFRLFSLCLTLH
jgi:hypothetical protein